MSSIALAESLLISTFKPEENSGINSVSDDDISPEEDASRDDSMNENSTSVKETNDVSNAGETRVRRMASGKDKIKGK